MKLTTEVLSAFVGGQLEIQNGAEGYLFRGEIESAVVEDDTVKVRFAWLAKGEGFPPIPTSWVNDDKLDYEAGLEIYNVSFIGDERISMNSPYTHELAVFFPPHGSKLDPAKVEGLELAT